MAMATSSTSNAATSDSAAKTPARRKITNLREHILNAQDREQELVYISGWDCHILVRSLTGAERARFQKQAIQQQPNGQAAVNWDRFWADLVILSAYDPDSGEKIFEPADRDGLLLKNARNLEVVAATARRLSGLEDNALANAKSADSDD